MTDNNGNGYSSERIKINLKGVPNVEVPKTLSLFSARLGMTANLDVVASAGTNDNLFEYICGKKRAQELFEKVRTITEAHNLEGMLDELCAAITDTFIEAAKDDGGSDGDGEEG